MMQPIQPFGLQLTSEPSHRAITDIAVSAVATLLKEHKLVLLREFSEIDRSSLLEYCQNLLGKSLGMKTLDWEFGPVMEMRESANPKNYLFSSERVPFHWDGAFHKTPHYLVFYCVDSDSMTGGETLFCNTQLVWNHASEDDKKLWSEIKLTYETAKVAHYGGKISESLVQRYPSATEPGCIQSPILRFAEEVPTSLNPVSLEIHGISEFQKGCFIEDLTKRIYSAEYCYRHRWKKGDVLIADNHALIHGREAFIRNSSRHLRRVQLI